MRNRRTSIRFPIFADFNVCVIVSRDVTRTGHRLGVDLADASAAWVTSTEKPGRGWLVLGLKPSEDTIAHEAAHAVRHILRYVGARPDDETYAYHLGYLVGRIHKFLAKQSA